MQTIFYSFGINYLKYSVDNIPVLKQEPLITRNDDIINIGDRITGIGPRRRTQFVLKDGLYMTYEGIYVQTEEFKWAIFGVDSHNQPGADEIYKYAFIICPDADNPEKVHCFLSGGKNGMRDVWLDPVKRF